MSKLPNNTHTLFHTCGDVVALVKALTGSLRRLYPQQNKNERKTKASLSRDLYSVQQHMLTIFLTISL
jgi:hypothetical protein